MIFTTQCVISRNAYPEIYNYLEAFSGMAKCLYNAALFRIRQVFTGWKTEPDKRHELQKNVFDELDLTKTVYQSVSFRKVLSYAALDKVMRATENKDFFAGLPMQTAQDVLRDAVEDFRKWLNGLAEWHKHPDKFTGKPNMPGYCKTDKKTYTFTNQDAVLYPVYDENGIQTGTELKLPKLKGIRLPVNHMTGTESVSEVKVKPYYGRFVLLITYTADVPVLEQELPNMAGIDFGYDNIAALVCNDGSSYVYKGGAIASNNRLFAKEKAKAVSDITRGTTNKGAHSAHLDNLSRWHDCYNKDQLHKISTDIIAQCLRHKVGVIVMGVNKFMKQNSNMGRKTNQNFVGMPLYQLRKMIAYKAVVAGIAIVEQEESYTSKADITSMDEIPVYGHEHGKPVFSGRRISRGRYCCGNGLIINADCNGAANILRKAFPSAWDETEDFRFLAHPIKRGYQDLNPCPHKGYRPYTKQAA